MRKFLFSGQEINKRGDIVSRQVEPLFTNLYNNTRISGIRLTKESVKAFTSALPSRAPASFRKRLVFRLSSTSKRLLGQTPNGFPASWP